MLLRFFVHFYDMEIIEEEAFLAWKEDITQEFPGKGKALFQVKLYNGAEIVKLFFQYISAYFHCADEFREADCKNIKYLA